ncbi:hypothetical protein TRIUR3_14201 [Triticum urartu]|uniref:F-box associated beta-propeller type 3 domain-containing protein n=1 Tax=Triticum urartu TaxID=4572 RepID=M7ZKN6_TRIUA|nr:hypothetical protein TRIUR3_14201 [Triticum urartu]
MATTVTPISPTVLPLGTVARAQIRQLNYQVLSFLGNVSNVHENMMLPNLDTFVLLAIEVSSMDKKVEHWSMVKHGDEARLNCDKYAIHVIFEMTTKHDDNIVLIRKDACSSIYNPATRQYAPIPALCDSKVSCNHILGMYRHHPTGEYRILVYGKNKETDYRHEEEICFYDDACYILALGSVQPLRNIGCPPKVEQLLLHREATTAVLFRGNLHWHIDQNETESNMIVVFDTTAESFRQMHAPVVPVFRNVPAYADLFDMDGVLGMLSCNEAADTIDIWVLQDYESEVWTFKCKIELPVIEIKGNCSAAQI